MLSSAPVPPAAMDGRCGLASLIMQKCEGRLFEGCRVPGTVRRGVSAGSPVSGQGRMHGPVPLWIARAYTLLMRADRAIMKGRKAGWARSGLAFLLAAMLSLAPAVAVSAPGSDMPGTIGPSCPMPGDDDAGPSMICAVAGGCVILPLAGPIPRPDVRRPAVGVPPVDAIRIGWNRAPEPPPPRLSAP